jgi:succinate dehydrogenase / fumarate reductase cytochrome b subunit
MKKALTLYDTTIGKKAAMAVTGLILFGFVIGHMLGNLQVYLGAEQLNGYAEKLHSLGPLLWVVRGVLAVAFLVHLQAAVQLTMRSRAARPIGYRQTQSIATTYAAKTMYITGPLLLLFVGYHLLHFTYPGIPMADTYEHTSNVYMNVLNGFSVPGVSIVYILAQIALGLHLYHGGWSLFQTLGCSHPRHGDTPRNIARFVAIVITLGNISIPVAVMAGVIG